MIFVCVVTAIGCAGPRPVPMVERFHVAFDDREWLTVYDDASESGNLARYVPKGATADQWTEMVTERSFLGLQTNRSADDEMHAAKRQAERACGEVSWSVEKQTPGSIIYAATLEDCSETRPRHEIGRFVVSPKAMYLVTYRSNAPTMADGLRAEWVDILSRASVEEVVAD